MEMDSYNALLNYSFRLLTRRNYLETELKEKLNRRTKKLNFNKEIVPRVIARLKELKYINDEKYFEDYFNYKLQNNPKGKFAFVSEMMRKRVNIANAKQEWDKRQIDEESLAMQLIGKRKFASASIDPLKRKKKIANALSAKGFSPEIIWKILEKEENAASD